VVSVYIRVKTLTLTRLCNARLSVRPSVCHVDRQRQRRAVGLLLTGCRSMTTACRSPGAGSRYRPIADGARVRVASMLDPRRSMTQACISQREFFFFRTDYMILQTSIVTCKHIRFYFLVFFCFTLFSCRFPAVD